MQPSRFSVLTGHLNDYPLSDLVGILRHQRKTGRLLIEYPKCPAMLFFKDGELVDAQFNQLSGLQAICVAFAQPPSSFNFNPLIKPYRRSIDSSMQKAVSEFLGCWDENSIEVERPVREFQRPEPAVASLPNGFAPAPESYVPQLPGGRIPLALPPAPRNRYSAPAMAMAAAGILMLGVSAFISVNRGIVTSASSPMTPIVQPSRVPEAATAAAPTDSDKTTDARPRETSRTVARSLRERSTHETKAETDSSEAQTTQEQATEAKGESSVRVVLQVENGRITQASIGNPKPGREAYEALALRIARQRRFPGSASGQQTVMIKVNE